MSQDNPKLSIWTIRVTTLSILLFFFTIPHTLEDFASGEPAKAGVSALVLSYGVAAVFALQGLALFWTGRFHKRGYIIHAILGLLWPLGAGLAQIPVILEPGVYRSGSISELFIAGTIVIGILLLYSSIQALRSMRSEETGN